MRLSLLRIIHKTLNRRAQNMNYIGFPTNLNSLENPSPSPEEIYSDYGLMRDHFKHPVFSDFIPTYQEMKNPEEAWIKRYIHKAN